MTILTCKNSCGRVSKPDVRGYGFFKGFMDAVVEWVCPECWPIHREKWWTRKQEGKSCVN